MTRVEPQGVRGSALRPVRRVVQLTALAMAAVAALAIAEPARAQDSARGAPPKSNDRRAPARDHHRTAARRTAPTPDDPALRRRMQDTIRLVLSGKARIA